MDLSSIIETKSNPDIPSFSPAIQSRYTPALSRVKKSAPRSSRASLLLSVPMVKPATSPYVASPMASASSAPSPFSRRWYAGRGDAPRQGAPRQLYYLRGLSTKASRIKERQLARGIGEVTEAAAKLRQKPLRKTRPKHRNSPLLTEQRWATLRSVSIRPLLSVAPLATPYLRLRN